VPHGHGLHQGCVSNFSPTVGLRLNRQLAQRSTRSAGSTCPLQRGPESVMQGPPIDLLTRWCRLALARRHAAHTPLEQAQRIRGLLTEELQTLMLLEEELKGIPQEHPQTRLPRQGVSRDRLPAKRSGRARDGHRRVMPAVPIVHLASSRRAMRSGVLARYVLKLRLAGVPAFDVGLPH
jgi:hypothetical protein